MEEIIARIKEYVLILDPSLEEQEELLDFSIADVVDRALIYMNRVQLIQEFEEDETATIPLPEVLERALARVVVSSFHSAQAIVEKEREASSVSDNGQSISFSGSLASYFGSSSDKELFGEVKSILDKYRIPTVV
jgi:hypothetical protein